MKTYKPTPERKIDYCYSNAEITLQTIWCYIRDFVIVSLTLAIIVGGYLLLTSDKVSAMSLKTTLTGKGEISLLSSESYDTGKVSQFISKYEKFSPTVIPDCSGKGYIIGFGFQPRGRTYMTRQEGISILNAEVRRLIPQVIQKYGYVSQNQMTALVSILYNTPTYRRVITDEEVIKSFKTRNEKRARELLKHSLRGVNTRRNEEIALFFNYTI